MFGFITSAIGGIFKGGFSPSSIFLIVMIAVAGFIIVPNKDNFAELFGFETKASLAKKLTVLQKEHDDLVKTNKRNEDQLQLHIQLRDMERELREQNQKERDKLAEDVDGLHKERLEEIERIINSLDMSSETKDTIIADVKSTLSPGEELLDTAPIEVSAAITEQHIAGEIMHYSALKESRAPTVAINAPLIVEKTLPPVNKIEAVARANVRGLWKAYDTLAVRGS